MPSCFRSLFNRLPELSLLNGLHLIGIHGFLVSLYMWSPFNYLFSPENVN